MVKTPNPPAYLGIQIPSRLWSHTYAERKREEAVREVARRQRQNTENWKKEGERIKEKKKEMLALKGKEDTLALKEEEDTLALEKEEEDTLALKDEISESPSQRRPKRRKRRKRSRAPSRYTPRSKTTHDGD